MVEAKAQKDRDTADKNETRVNEEMASGTITRETGKRKKQAIEKARLRIDRWMKLWQPCDRRTGLEAVKTESGEKVTQAGDKARLLAAEWGKVFAKAPVDERLAGAIARHFSEVIGTDDIEIPSTDDFLEVGRKAPRSAPGPDGLSYDFWQAAGLEGATTLKLVMWEAMNQGTTPENFCDAWGCYLPKGEADEGDKLVARSAAETRPLALKNTDNKLIAAVLNKKLKYKLPGWADAAQHGFVKGRQAVDAIVDMDTGMRVTDWEETAMADKMPLAALFDYAAAFPSVAHAYLFAVLKAVRLPVGMRKTVAALYKNNDTFLQEGGRSSGCTVWVQGFYKAARCPALSSQPASTRPSKCCGRASGRRVYSVPSRTTWQ